MYALFTVTVALAATLTFSIQPLMGKMFLPVMGGTPAVWNTAMVFFQVMLLLGYLYTHCSVRYLGVRRQMIVHGLLVIAAFAVLPVSVDAPNAGAVSDWPAAWVLLILLTTVGLPFLVVTSTTPLVQRWLAATDHPLANDPYHLYAASNVGSVLALLSYPFVVEPALGLGQQSVVWLGGYAVLVVCLAVSATLMRQHSGECIPDAGGSPARAPPGAGERLRWFAYAFVPSSLLLAVTSVATTDLAPMPLLWVVPLCLYLISHIHAFARHRLVATRWWLRLLPLLLLPAAALAGLGIHQPPGPLLVFHFAVLAVAGLAFHGLLADSRPEPSLLTEFYVWLAVGGAAGGVFNALIAPQIFARLLEYPLVLALALALLLCHRGPARDGWLNATLGTGLLVSLSLWFIVMVPFTDIGWSALALWVVGVVGTLAGLLVARRHPGLLRGAAMTGALMAVAGATTGKPDEIHAARSFYGTHSVLAKDDGAYHVLRHGNTAHGVQEVDRAGAPEALAYYHEDGPLGEIFAAVNNRAPRGDIAVVGLGAGSAAALRSPYQRMTFFEIDREVARIARDPELFTYLDRCGQGCEVRIGDGRLQLAAAEREFDLIVLDAYSSAAIPIHLLTREAMELFMQRLDSDGVLAFHISNPHIDLAPVLARIAEELELVVRHKEHGLPPDAPDARWLHDSEWIVLAQSERSVEDFNRNRAWQSVIPRPGPAWSDQFAPVWHLYAQQR